jgi:HJR/Mrr/RecB family endonuclease
VNFFNATKKFGIALAISLIILGIIAIFIAIDHGSFLWLLIGLIIIFGTILGIKDIQLIENEFQLIDDKIKNNLKDLLINSHKMGEFRAIENFINNFFPISINSNHRLYKAIYGNLDQRIEESLQEYKSKVIKDENFPTEAEYQYYFDTNYISIIKKYLKVLAQKKKQLIKVDDYDIEDDTEYEKEINHFMSHILNIDFNHNSISGHTLFFCIYSMVNDYIIDTLENTINNNIYDDNIDPIEYEYFCKDLLVSDGWNARVTQATGDQGVDILATNNNCTIAVQCKKYSSPVGNKAVQEIFTAKEHYGADIAIVVTNNTYTKSAKELANSTNVLLLHHDQLRDLSSIILN